MLAQRLAVLALSALSVQAQQFVVDVHNGPGTHFTSLGAAVASVPSGALLRVRAGNYFEAVDLAGKSMTILGDPGAQVFPPFSSAFRIRGLARTIHQGTSERPQSRLVPRRAAGSPGSVVFATLRTGSAAQRRQRAGGRVRRRSFGE